MSKLPLAIIGIIVIVLGVIASSALFTVDQREQVIVLQFGEPTRVIREPDLPPRTIPPFKLDLVLLGRPDLAVAPI